MTNQPNPAQQASEEYKLHVAICNAVILLNNGEEIAPRVSAILREALFNYAETPARELTAAQGVSDDKYRRALQIIHDFAEEGATHWEWAVARVAREALGIPGGDDENDDA